MLFVNKKLVFYFFETVTQILISNRFQIQKSLIFNFFFSFEIFPKAFFLLSHYRQVVGGIVVFDVTNRNSIENVRKWVEEVRYYAEPDMILLIVGNKVEKETEKERVISKAKAQQLAKDLEAAYYETSIWEEKSVEIVFETLARKIYDKKEIFRKMNLEKLKKMDDGVERKSKCF